MYVCVLACVHACVHACARVRVCVRVCTSVYIMCVLKPGCHLLDAALTNEFLLLMSDSFVFVSNSLYKAKDGDRLQITFRKSLNISGYCTSAVQVNYQL